MATISTITEVFGRNTGKIDLANKSWKQLTLGTNLHSVYLIAIKDTKVDGDTIDADKITKLVFEIAIDSGISGKPVTIENVTLDFNTCTSSDEEISKITAFTRLLNLPSNISIRCIGIQTETEQLKEGFVSSIDINVSPIDLGY